MPTAAQVSPRTGRISSMTTQEAFDELSLLDNFELVKLLEAWIKGSISFARTHGYEIYPNVCALGALKEYRQHDSWYFNYPWHGSPRDRHLTAMSKLVHDLCNGHSITELYLVGGNASEDEAPAIPGGIRHDVESDVGMEGDDEKTDGGDQASGDDNEELEDNEKAWCADEDIGVDKGGHDLIESEDGDEDTDGTIPAVATLLPTSRRSSKAEAKAAVRGSTTDASHPLPRRQARAQSRRAVPGAAPPRPQHRSQTKKYKNASSASRRGHTVRTDSKTGEQYGAWFFERILDSRWARAGGKQKGRRRDVEYKVKWTYGKWTWQPSLDLQDNPKDIAAFHKAFPEKPGPPGWFRRARTQRN